VPLGGTFAGKILLAAAAIAFFAYVMMGISIVGMAFGGTNLFSTVLDGEIADKPFVSARHAR
jgi:hypothetical protein